MAQPEVHDTAAIVAQRDSTMHSYGEFIRTEWLSVGLSIWPAGSSDGQRPHAEDEVYYCVRGRARIRIGTDEHVVGPGSVIYVPSGMEHQFHSIEQDLVVTVFWAPPHHSLEPDAGSR